MISDGEKTYYTRQVNEVNCRR